MRARFQRCLVVSISSKRVDGETNIDRFPGFADHDDQ